jgi:ribosomal protein S18 acetylase RimI-like enzyme
VMKLQGLMELEFKEKKIDKNPNDLKKGDLGCDSRAPRTAKARAAPSEAAAATKGRKGSKGGSRKRKAAAEWDDEQEEWPVEAIIDSRGATADDVAKYADVEGADVTLGSAFYLVVWEGWDSSYNSWEPYSFIVDDQLIQEYEGRANAAQDEVAEMELDEAEEAAAEVEAEATAEATAEPEVTAETATEEEPASPTGGHGDAPADLPSFRSEICACVPADLQLQMAAIEADFMDSRERNGPNFEEYLSRWDYMAHMAIGPSGELIGFAISGTEQRGTKVFLYELHVKDGQRRRGVGTALMEMAERTARGANRTMELNVHKDNHEALYYYEKKCGFGRCGELSNGLSFVMRRKL